ncbi:Methylmalonate semialdehyde dehydrogenase [acylating] [archaeon HR01]|nr:Methylmalonate semialdehyde dehydrogenase [acylating] [archaeon HR01]
MDTVALHRLQNYAGGVWRDSQSEKVKEIYDPGRGVVIGSVPFSLEEEVDEAVEAAAVAFEGWRNKPLSERIRYLFRMRRMFEDHFEEFARVNTLNHGKTLEESRGDITRALENVDMAIAAAQTLGKGENLDQISDGIDEFTSKEPLGVFAIVSPFNFPVMIPFWFLPYAIVLGNTVVVKPSEITPLPMEYVAKMIDREVGLPAGVFNLIHGGREVVEYLIRNKDVVGVTFVGSTQAAHNVYRLAGEHGKRVIAQGGAKNCIVVMPDADLDRYMPSIVSSFFGNAGQRCLAGSNLVLVGDREGRTKRKFITSVSSLRLGHGLDPDTDMGPLVSLEAKKRVKSLIALGIEEGADLILDGREASVEKYPDGFFLGPTVFESVSKDMSISKTEIFGPVASIMEFNTLDEALDMVNNGSDYGNMACIFTSNGGVAREFRRRANAGNIGINIGVAAPAAYFPFAGRKKSFYGVLHAQADTIDFFTDRKVVISRW